jgi:uncharacterized protein (TIGR02246 family)
MLDIREEVDGGEAMPLSANDRCEIEELYARYCIAVDALDGNAWADCFTPDGVMVPCTGVDRGRVVRGREQLVAHGAKADRERRCRHWTSNLSLVERDGWVEGTCYGMRVDISSGRAEVVSSAVYHDELVRHDGRWRFRARRPERDAENDAPAGAENDE